MWTWWVWWWWWWCSFFFFFFLNVNAAVSRSCALLINDLPWWWLSDVSLICPNMEIGLNTKRQMITSSLHAVETNIFFGLVMEQIHKERDRELSEIYFFFLLESRAHTRTLRCSVLISFRQPSIKWSIRVDYEINLYLNLPKYCQPLN